MLIWIFLYCVPAPNTFTVFSHDSSWNMERLFCLFTCWTVSRATCCLQAVEVTAKVKKTRCLLCGVCVSVCVHSSLYSSSIYSLFQTKCLLMCLSMSVFSEICACVCKCMSGVMYVWKIFEGYVFVCVCLYFCLCEHICKSFCVLCNACVNHLFNILYIWVCVCDVCVCVCLILL